jgi:hypothetical protein
VDSRCAQPAADSRAIDLSPNSRCVELGAGVNHIIDRAPERSHTAGRFPEQRDDFLERLRSDLLKPVTRDDELAARPVDHAEASLGRDDIFEPAVRPICHLRRHALQSMLSVDSRQY